MIHAIRRLRLQRTWSDRVWIAPAVQQEVFVLHVRETFGIESDADEVEVGVEAVNLDGILDIVVGRAVTVVVGVTARSAMKNRCCANRTSIYKRQRAAAQNISVGIAFGAQIELLTIERGIEVASDAILPWAHIELPNHAHLQVLGRRDMAVPEVSTGIRREVVISEAGADVDGNRGVGHTVIERRSVGITVEVD